MATKRSRQNTFTVIGTVTTDEGEVEPFKESVTAATQGEARWAIRRKLAPGEPLAELEPEPPNPEREAMEIAAPNTLEQAIEQGQTFFHPRTKARAGSEQSEYERLVRAVAIESIVEER